MRLQALARSLLCSVLTIYAQVDVVLENGVDEVTIL